MSDYQEKLVPAKESRGSSLASFPSSLSMDFSEATIPLESFRTRSRLLLNRIFASLKKKQVYKFVAILLLVTCVTVLRNGRNEPSLFTAVNKNTVSKKKDLLNVDISKQLRFIPWSKLPLNEETTNQQFKKAGVTGFVSNLVAIRDTFKCEDCIYDNTIEYSDWSELLEDDLIALRRQMLKRNNALSKEVKDKKEDDWSEEKIIKEHWFRFGGAPIWLETEQCFLVFTRLGYTRGNKGHPHVSLIRAQAFDRDWKEIQNKRIPFSDVVMPSDLDKELQLLDRELGASSCDPLQGEPTMYEECIVEKTKNSLKSTQRREEILSRYFLTFPTIIDVPFVFHGDLNGPEDPHVILRKTESMEEPVLVFNMLDEVEKKRRIFSFMPFRKIDPLVKFTVPSLKLNEKEKNWTPFFHNDFHNSKLSRGTIHFIYSFKPLRILQCSLNDGICDVVFGKTERSSDDDKDGETYGSMRGGTQFYKLPSVLPGIEDKTMWLGFPKLHLFNSGCNTHYYRPMMALLVEEKGTYNLELEVPVLDFGLDVKSWNLKGYYCDHISILSPNSIAYWEVVNQDPVTKEYEDYLAVSMSEADTFSRVIVLKGVLNYILGIYRDKQINESFQLGDEASIASAKTLKCMDEFARQQSSKYDKSHPKP
ncbi:hypothetical protein NCAS_0J00200 [Naumovozyma castellii]|uniref:Glycosyltransferase family 91 protein n=1 Tax=Naumovozyma castellii TaxID=27288 RepID=G0VKG6_NAUCA|nr:hypothetical protein NCAS_0J00200 [Naumovozyma castellii CBS 4309]CCC72000.1 hypothetical protein NCAS_0J00200 [Naumovozyma castellii CBS 4309]